MSLMTVHKCSYYLQGILIHCMYYWINRLNNNIMGTNFSRLEIKTVIKECGRQLI